VKKDQNKDQLSRGSEARLWTADEAKNPYEEQPGPKHCQKML